LGLFLAYFPHFEINWEGLWDYPAICLSVRHNFLRVFIAAETFLPSRCQATGDSSDPLFQRSDAMWHCIQKLFHAVFSIQSFSCHVLNI
jgi:hypothetical protein